MKSKEVYAQAAAKAKAALEVDNDEERTRLVAEADALFKKATELKSAEGLLDQMREPQMPADLPVDEGAGTNPAPEKKENDAIKAVYQTRYGEPDAAIKSILLDLHGSDYEQKRWGSWQNFVKYLRTGAGANREHLWTPEDVKDAIKAGQDVYAMKTTMVEAQDTLGGYAVPADFRADVISRMQGLTVVRQNGARIISTSSDRLELPSMTGGGSQYRDAVRVNWVAETPANAAASAENLTLGLETIAVHTCMANTDLSRNLVEDAAFNLVEWLAGSFASAMAIDEDNQFLVGDGAGKPSGILRDSGIGALGTGQQVASGNASALTADGLIALVWKLDAQYRQRAVLIAEKATWEAVAKLKDGDGQYLWRQNYGDNVSVGGGGTINRLLGYPVLEQEGLPTIASDAFPIIFGDLSGYVIADRTGLSVERYLDSSNSVTNTIRYVMRRRLGGKVTELWKFAAQKVSAS